MRYSLCETPDQPEKNGKDDWPTEYSPADPSFTGANETHETIDFFQPRQIGFDAGQGVGDRQALAKEDFVCLADGRLSGFGNALPLHPDLVDAASLGWIAIGQ